MVIAISHLLGPICVECKFHSTWEWNPPKTFGGKKLDILKLRTKTSCKLDFPISNHEFYKRTNTIGRFYG